jgi:hypothetical protein
MNFPSGALQKNSTLIKQFIANLKRREGVEGNVITGR